MPTSRPKRARLIGVTGSIGSGKSTACAILAERYPVLHSDEIAKDIIGTDPAVQAEIRRVFGNLMFDEGGGLRRQELADIVFQDPEKLALLNAIVHPRTIEQVDREAGDFFASGHTLVFVESALIFEAGIEEMFDAIMVIAASPQTISDRILASRRFSEDDWSRRNAVQMPLADKSARADFTIHNDGTPEELRDRIRFITMILESMSR